MCVCGLATSCSSMQPSPLACMSLHVSATYLVSGPNGLTSRLPITCTVTTRYAPHTLFSPPLQFRPIQNSSTLTADSVALTCPLFTQQQLLSPQVFGLFHMTAQLLSKYEGCCALPMGVSAVPPAIDLCASGVNVMVTMYAAAIVSLVTETRCICAV